MKVEVICYFVYSNASDCPDENAIYEIKKKEKLHWFNMHMYLFNYLLPTQAEIKEEEKDDVPCRLLWGFVLPFFSVIGHLVFERVMNVLYLFNILYVWLLNKKYT